MTVISVISMHSTPGADDHSPQTIAAFCCVGLVISLCLIMAGVDLGANWA
jgi:hypothetical protein